MEEAGKGLYSYLPREGRVPERKIEKSNPDIFLTSKERRDMAPVFSLSKGRGVAPRKKGATLSREGS